MDRQYVLFTPGPLTTTLSVKEAMLADSCTWDDDYKQVVQSIRSKLLDIGHADEAYYTTVLMQGSGTFGVEAAIGSIVPRDGELLILTNGLYGQRMEEIAEVKGIKPHVLPFPYDEALDPARLDDHLTGNLKIDYVAFVHCETTTGILNPLEDLMKVIKKHGKTAIVDAMSSFGGIPVDMKRLDIDFLISSANKCIQGVPGFSFIIGKKTELNKCAGNSVSLSLDLYKQWREMEDQSGKWRYTSPTHTVLAFRQALLELEQEGGVEARQDRYRNNQRLLVDEMEKLGFQAFLDRSLQSPVITAFRYPEGAEFTFADFYGSLKAEGSIIYPGKLTDVDLFRVGTIGDVHEEDIRRLCEAAGNYLTTRGGLRDGK